MSDFMKSPLLENDVRGGKVRLFPLLTRATILKVKWKESDLSNTEKLESSKRTSASWYALQTGKVQVHVA